MPALNLLLRERLKHLLTQFCQRLPEIFSSNGGQALGLWASVVLIATFATIARRTGKVTDTPVRYPRAGSANKRRIRRSVNRQRRHTQSRCDMRQTRIVTKRPRTTCQQAGPFTQAQLWQHMGAAKSIGNSQCLLTFRLAAPG